jgi:hypothetical protein
MSLLGVDGEEGYSSLNTSSRGSVNRVGLVAIVALYFTAIAAFIAILALVNVNWNTETLSKMMIALSVLMGAIGVGVVYIAAGSVIPADQFSLVSS